MEGDFSQEHHRCKEIWRGEFQVGNEGSAGRERCLYGHCNTATQVTVACQIRAEEYRGRKFRRVAVPRRRLLLPYTARNANMRVKAELSAGLTEALCSDTRAMVSRGLHEAGSIRAWPERLRIHERVARCDLAD